MKNVMFFFVSVCLLFSSFTVNSVPIHSEVTWEEVFSGGDIELSQDLNSITIVVTNNSNNLGVVKITDQSGKLIYSITYIGNTVIRINTSGYSPGEYLLAVTAGSTVEYLQFKK